MSRLRVALVQLESSGHSRAARLQGVLSMIDRAAEHDPSPDLIVLPAFVDVARAFAGESTGIEHVVGQTGSAVGQRARSWGVFIVYGQAERSAGKTYITSVLLDNDGDARLRHRQTVFAQACKAVSTGEGLSVTDTMFGRIGLMTGDDVLEAAIWEKAQAAGAKLIVASLAHLSRVVDAAANPGSLGTVEAFSHRFGIPIVMAGMTNEKSAAPGLTAWIEPDGIRFRSTSAADEIKHLELPAPVPAEKPPESVG